MSAEKLYERRWATPMLDEVLARLEKEFIGLGNAALFAELQVFLLGDKMTPSDGYGPWQRQIRIRYDIAAIRPGVATGRGTSFPRIAVSSHTVGRTGSTTPRTFQREGCLMKTCGSSGL
jgi:hypothetical protein